ALESLCVCEIQKDLRKIDIVLDDEHCAIALFKVVAIVEDRDRFAGQQRERFGVEVFCGRPRGLYLFQILLGSLTCRSSNGSGRHVVPWQVKRKSAALAGNAGYP